MVEGKTVQEGHYLLGCLTEWPSVDIDLSLTVTR